MERFTITGRTVVEAGSLAEAREIAESCELEWAVIKTQTKYRPPARIIAWGLTNSTLATAGILLHTLA